MKDLNTNLEKLTNYIAEIRRNYFEGMKYSNVSEMIKITKTEGKKYIKIFADNSLYCFIDKETGNIYKAANYSTPAKHARANLFLHETWKDNLEVYSPKYLK